MNSNALLHQCRQFTNSHVLVLSGGMGVMISLFIDTIKKVLLEILQVILIAAGKHCVS